MKDVEIIGLIKTYIKQTLVGMGALKGAACQISSIVDSGTSHVITFSWQDNAGVTHTNTLTLVDGADEVDELKDISITNLQDGQVLAWDNTAHKWVNTANSSTVASINNIGDVTVTNVTNGQILEWNDTASKWVNASLGTAAKKDSTNAVTENSTDVVESGAVFTAIDDAVKALDVSDTAVVGSYVTEVSETDGKISVAREAADATPTENSNKLVKSGGVYSAIDDAVKALDVSDTAVVGSYVTEVSETDGKISVAREAADATPTENSNKLVKSGGVYSAIDDAVKALDVSDTAVVGSYVTEVSETDGKISVAREAADATPTENSNKLVKSGGVYSAIDDAVKALDVSDTAVVGSYVTEVSETDGKISVVREAADAAPTESSNKLVKSGGVYSAIDDAVKALDVSDTAVAGSYVTEVSETDGKISVAREAADATPTENSNKLVKSGGIFASEQYIYKANGLLGAKNLLPYPYKRGDETINGITSTVNADGTVILNGTATAATSFIFFEHSDNKYSLPEGNYTVSAVAESGTYTGTVTHILRATEGGSGVIKCDKNIGVEGTFNIPSEEYIGYQINIASGASLTNLKIAPMIRLASDIDSTYQPYAKTNRDLTVENEVLTNEVDTIVNVLGAKNLLISSLKTNTYDGLTFTVNDDGSVTLSGTAETSCGRYGGGNFGAFSYPAGEYLLSDGGAGSQTTKRRMYYSINGSSANPVVNSSKISLQDTDVLEVWIYVDTGVSGNGVTFYPMLRLASIDDDTYVPYAKSNRELTENIAAAITDVYEVTTPAFSSLPQTFNAPGITSDHKLIVDGSAVLSTPSAQVNDWTITTGSNSITISGNFAGSTATTVKMTLGIKRAITATV